MRHWTRFVPTPEMLSAWKRHRRFADHFPHAAAIAADALERSGRATLRLRAVQAVIVPLVFALYVLAAAAQALAGGLKALSALIAAPCELAERSASRASERVWAIRQKHTKLRSGFISDGDAVIRNRDDAAIEAADTPSVSTVHGWKGEGR